jgi:hypothetical protein
MLLCYNLELIIIGTNGNYHGHNTKKHETMLNGKFASYKLKANSYINLGNVDPLFSLKL